MATVDFEVASYDVELGAALEFFADGRRYTKTAQIVCAGKEYVCVVIFLDETPLPENSYFPERKYGSIYMTDSRYLSIVDLLRNERPVRIHLDSDVPADNHLYTEREPVGEGEVGDRMASPA